jgi:sugar-specific transcriptional regulator TrmB
MSERQAKVYLALLLNGRATSSELQKTSGVPQSKIYEIVRQLVSLGYCTERKDGHKRTFEALDPQTALLSEFQRLETARNEISLLRDDLSKQYVLGQQDNDPIEYIEMLNGAENIHYHYCHLVSNTKSEILGFGREPYAWKTHGALLEQERHLQSVLDRGGTSRWIFQLRLPDHKLVFEYMERMQANGVAYRISDSIPIKMMVFDKQVLLLADEGPAALRGELSMSIIKHSTIVNAFLAYFEYIWDMAIDFDKWKEKQKLIN